MVQVAQVDGIAQTVLRECRVDEHLELHRRGAVELQDSDNAPVTAWRYLVAERVGVELRKAESVAFGKRLGFRASQSHPTDSDLARYALHGVGRRAVDSVGRSSLVILKLAEHDGTSRLALVLLDGH